MRTRATDAPVESVRSLSPHQTQRSRNSGSTGLRLEMLSQQETLYACD